MTGYFGSEPTCRRCDYPRRLHHLLRVEHDYEPGKEDAPGAGGAATEGKESASQQKEESMTHNTATPASYLVRAEVDGAEQIIAHTATFPRAVERTVAHSNSYFGTTEVHRVITDRNVFATGPDGHEITYRIYPLDRPLPENEPSCADVDAAIDPRIPTMHEIVEAAVARNFGSITPHQADEIRDQLIDFDPGYGHDQMLEVAMLAAEQMNSDNLVTMVAGMVDEIGPPRGFDGAIPDRWTANPRTGRIGRYWDIDFSTAISPRVCISVHDEIRNGRIVRDAPTIQVYAEDDLNRDGACALIDALTVATRFLAEAEGADL